MEGSLIVTNIASRMHTPLLSCRRAVSRRLSGRARTLLSRLLFANQGCAVIRSGLLAGHRIYAPLNERMAFGMGSYEPQVMAECEKIIGADCTFYDIGAHIGFFSMLAAKKGARVFSFEANPDNIARLRQNIAANGFEKVTAVAQAVAETSGYLEFATFGFSLVGSIACAATPSDAVIIKVPSVSLDHFVYEAANPPPTLMKIDVEGAEGEVLRGAKRLLQQHRPILLIEIHSAEQQAAVVAQTDPLGYKWRRLDSVSPILEAKEVGQFIGVAAAD